VAAGNGELNVTTSTRRPTGLRSPHSSAAVAGRKPETGIRFEEVTVAYRRHVVLDKFTLTVEPGEVMALLGPSGSGKTTALRSLAGFVQPVSGRVFIKDRDVTGVAPYARGVGMVVQQYALFPHMRVVDNVAFGLKAQKADRALIATRTAEALEMVGMADYTQRYPRELSGGQQQRVAIARALAIQPSVLLLDEPLSALDEQLRSGMLAEIARLHRELPDLSILYVTHNQIEALTLADRIAVMAEARLVEVGPTKKLYQQPAQPFTAGFLGNANLLPVVVENAEAGNQRITVRMGDHLFAVTSPQPANRGDVGTLCIHPHCLAPFDGTDGPGVENSFTGAVTDVQWRGSTHRLLVQVGGQSLRVDATAMRQPPEVGQQLTVRFTGEDGTFMLGQAHD
jgi:2-aminoethylphosphonate transport system ATP-binding protein